MLPEPAYSVQPGMPVDDAVLMAAPAVPPQGVIALTMSDLRPFALKGSFHVQVAIAVLATKLSIATADSENRTFFMSSSS